MERLRRENGDANLAFGPLPVFKAFEPTPTREEFWQLVRRVVASGKITVEDLCEIFDVSVPTAQRWYNRQTAPMPATRRYVSAKLASL